MQYVIGESESNRLIVLKNTAENHQEIHSLDVNSKHNASDLILKCPSIKCVQQASIQNLVKDSFKCQSLLSLVFSESDTFEANLFLLENLLQNFSSSPNYQEKCASIVILEEIPLVKAQPMKLQIHILPTNPKEADPSIPLGMDTPCLKTPAGGGSDLVVLRNRVIALSLGECITIYEIETTLSSVAGAKLEIISSEFVAKSFWWSQWVPQGQFLAFAHYRKPQYSRTEEDSSSISGCFNAKPILSVFQFRRNFPQETVLNLPLDPEVGRRNSIASRQRVFLASNPNVLCKDRTLDHFRILAHASGHVSILQIPSPNAKDDSSKVLYKLNALHHQKTLVAKWKESDLESLIIDACLFQSGQFVAVMAYPVLLHLLDIGVEHDPSHHIVLNWSSLPKTLLSENVRIFNSSITGSSLLPIARSANTQLVLLDENLNKTELEINSALLIPMLLNQKPEIHFNLAVLHYLVVHLCDVNAAKKVIYEMGKSLSSPFLTEMLQEFLISNSYLMTNKNLMPNMKIFLHFLPYTSQITKCSRIVCQDISIETVSNTAAVSSILLSPRQRILPQSAVDIWTQLWEVSGLLSKSSRFCHRSIAQKLLLSLQCYQPEALSRATTPMSPSSPMVCNSLGDIAAIFGRRTSDLQLPFVEHESCTANKQEYVYSVNLRELSTHLLKERRDWPLHGQTVAGKYMNSLVESARLLCHLACLCVHLQPNRKCKGFMLIDSLTWEIRLKLFMLFEHISIALGTLASPLPQGFTPFFAYLGYNVLKYDQFLWHVRSGTFDLQIDLVKTIMADLVDSEDDNAAKKLHLISLLPKSRATRVLNSWSHQAALCIRARQHASDLLSGVTSLTRKSVFATQGNRLKLKGAGAMKDTTASPLDTFLLLLTAKANVADIDLGLLAEATMLSMQLDD